MPRATGRKATALVAALLLTIVLAPTPQAAVGRDTWEDPNGEWPTPVAFNDDFSSLSALFIVNGDEPGCREGVAPAVPADLELARDVRDLLIDQGADAANLTILSQDGSGVDGPADEASIRKWLIDKALAMNEDPDARLLVYISGHGDAYHFFGGKYARISGSKLCLHVNDLDEGPFEDPRQWLYDHELGTLLANFKAHVQVGTMVSCSLCGGFADRIHGPVQPVGTHTVFDPRADDSGMVRENRVVAVGCGIVTECTAHPEHGANFLRFWFAGIRTGLADGWTHIGDQSLMLPYDSMRRDGRITLEEAYWWALNEVLAGSEVRTSPIGVAPPAGLQRYQINDQLAGGFTITTGGAAFTPYADQPPCGDATTSDHDGDGLVDALDALNHPDESLAKVPAGGYVRTHRVAGPTAPVVVTSPSGHQVTLTSFSDNLSLDAFVDGPMDGTWTFEHRPFGAKSAIESIHLGGRSIHLDTASDERDLVTVVWNWHTGAYTDETLVLDVNECVATSLRFYTDTVPEDGALP